MARNTRKNILEIDNLIGKLESFTEAASKASNALFEFQAMDEAEKKKRFGDEKAQAAEEKRLKNAKSKADAKLKVETERLSDTVGDSADKFSELAKELREFGLDLKNTGGAFDNLLGAGGQRGLLGFFGQMTEEQSSLQKEIIDRNKKLTSGDLTKRQREIILEEIAEREHQIKLFQVQM